MQRLASLDVFRGAAVALMILVNNPGTWQHLYGPLAHAPWHGITPTDLVFPFFLFAVGNALALVMPALAAAPPGGFAAKVARRGLVVFGLGLFLSASPFVRWDAAGELVMRDWSTLRVMGVLQRIALAWAAAALLVWGLGRLQAGAGGLPQPGRVLAAAAVLLVGYWAACVAFAAPGADPYSLEGFFGTALDRALLGPSHLYRGEGVPFDPEGLASTVPAIAQVLLGWWVGDLVRREAAPVARPALIVRLFVIASALLALGYAWQLVMPLNKKLWTSSYVVVTTGLAVALLALLLHAIEGRATRAVAAAPAGGSMLVRGLGALVAQAGAAAKTVLEAFGRNALFVFVLSGFVPRLLGLVRLPDETGTPRPLLAWVHQTWIAPLAADPRLGSLLFALANLALYAAIALVLDARRIYIRV